MINLEEYGADERRLAEAARQPELSLARICSQHREIYGAVCAEGEITARLAGRFRREAEESGIFPAVGDFVMFGGASEGEATIQRVLERRGVFERALSGGRGGAQVIAANVDVVFICMSLNGNYSLNRLERCLAVAYAGGARPVALLTKADICENSEELAESARLAAPGVDVLLVCGWDEGSVTRVRQYIPRGATASFIGSSGVGKSTLINALLGREALATAEIRAADGKGRHTTTSRELMLLPSGGAVIDTPGMRELAADLADVEPVFSDVAALAERCRFASCTHTSEPGCAVLAALESGELNERRYKSYLKLTKEARYDGLNSREIENAKISGMFGSKREMKKLRDFHKNKR